MLVNHVADLDRKLGSARFNVDQLQVGPQRVHEHVDRVPKGAA
jgi:hypothetical protein